MILKFMRLIETLFLTPEKFALKKGVKIGVSCNIQTRYFGSEPYLIEIGDKVQVTSGVKFFTHGGGWIFRDEYPKFDTFGKIKVGNNVYIGNDALIMPGVTIPNNCIIGAGSIVTKSFNEDGVVIAGVPAKVIGTVEELKNNLLPYNLETKGLSYKQKKEILLRQPDSAFLKK